MALVRRCLPLRPIPETGLHSLGMLQLLLWVPEAGEGVVALVPFDGPVEGRGPVRSTGLAAATLSAGLDALHVLHRQAARLQHVQHSAQNILSPQGEAHRAKP